MMENRNLRVYTPEAMKLIREQLAQIQIDSMRCKPVKLDSIGAELAPRLIANINGDGNIDTDSMELISIDLVTHGSMDLSTMDLIGIYKPPTRDELLKPVFSVKP